MKSSSNRKFRLCTANRYSVLLFRLTVDTTTELLFGESVNSHITNLSENIRKACTLANNRFIDGVCFVAAFDHAQAWLSDQSSLVDKYWMDDGPSRRRNVRNMHESVNYFVHRSLG